MDSIRRLLRRAQRRSISQMSEATKEPGPAAQGRLICEGRIRVKGTGFYNTWKPAWAELRESHEWKPVLEFHEENPIDQSRVLVESIEVWYVRRMNTKKCTLRVESQSRRRKFYLHFSKDIELYDWLEEVYTRCPGSGIVDYETFSHDLHIREPNEAGNITGFPRSVVEYVDMYSITSSITSENNPPPRIEASQLGISSADTAPIVTPKSSLPGHNVEIASDDDSVIDVPRVDLPEDYIGFAPSTRDQPNVLDIQRIVVLPKRSDHREPDFPSGSTLNIQRQNDYSRSREPVVHVRDLTRSIKQVSRYPVATGGFSDVYKAQLIEGGESVVVGIKLLREPLSSPVLSRKIARRLKSEINVWHLLDHPNVVQLLGICRHLGPRPALVSLWYENGDVMRYLEDLGHKATLLLKLKLILDIANGLSYLHSFLTPVLHCDLKAANVLVNRNGTACLADFGLSSLFENLTSSKSLSDSGALNGSVRWMAVELVCSLGEENGVIRFTPKTDVYSFGSTMLEILSGKVPYYTRRLDAQVIMDIYKGVRHRREETGISLMHWQLMERCWADIPEERPSSETIVRELECYYYHGLCDELDSANNRLVVQVDDSASDLVHSENSFGVAVF